MKIKCIALCAVFCLSLLAGCGDNPACSSQPVTESTSSAADGTTLSGDITGEDDSTATGTEPSATQSGDSTTSANKDTTTGKKDTTTGKKDTTTGKKDTTTGKKDTMTGKKDTSSKTTTKTTTGNTPVTVGEPTYALESSWLKETQGLYNASKVWSSQRYVMDVYLSGVKASNGKVILEFNNTLLQYMGCIDSDGIDTKVTAVGKKITLEWNGTVDSTAKRVKIAQVRFFFAKFGMTLQDIKKNDAAKVVGFSADSQLVGGKKAKMIANKYTGEVNPAAYPLELSSVKVGNTSLSAYKIVVKKSDATATRVATLVQTFVKDKVGYDLAIVDEATAASTNEIVIGVTNRKASPISGTNRYKVFRDGTKIYLFFGNARSGEEAAGAFATDIIGKSSAGYNTSSRAVSVSANASVDGTYDSLARFAMLADIHIGTIDSVAGNGFATKAYTNISKNHADNPLDFVVSIGDNIDYGYDSGGKLTSASAKDYSIYLEVIKGLTICDPVNPYGSKMDKSKIPHYELKGNHDPSVNTRFIGGLDSQLTSSGEADTSLTKRENMWYVTSKSGKKTAFITAEALYAEYPKINNQTNAYGKVVDSVLKEVEANLKAAKKAKADHIVFFCHFSLTHIDHIIDEQGRVALFKLFEEYGVETYFNGHEHANIATATNYSTANGVYNISVPSAHPMKVFSSIPYYGIVEIGDNSMNIQWYKSMDGTLADTTVIPLN